MRLCTVRLDGVPVRSCLVAAGQVEGCDVVTVEGLADYARQRAEGGCSLRRLRVLRHLLDEAKGWSAKGTDSHDRRGHRAVADPAGLHRRGRRPVRLLHGLLVAADEMLERNPSPTDEDIREALSGNLCRCTGYEKILDAVRLAAARQERQGLQEGTV